MSRRAELRRQARAAHRPETPSTTADELVAVVPGWCQSAGDLPATRRATHDILIHITGNQRRSGVSWRTLNGPTAVAAASDLGSSGTPEWRHHCNTIRRALIDRGGYLVLASAAGDPNEEP
jgi:hypothetical protein